MNTITQTERIKKQGRFPHNCSSPFPVRITGGPNVGRFVDDEKCSCGAMRSAHTDTLAYGHGACPPFSCPRFTWASHVFASRYVQAKLADEAT